MKIIAINGSHRKGKNTATMLSMILDEAKTAGAEVELLEITDYNIKPCKSCNKCLRKPACSITDDDMGLLAQKMLDADGIVLGSPVYFGNVTGLLKIFMDRTRWMHMCENLLEGRVGAAVTHAGLRNGGQEITLFLLERFLAGHGLYVIESRTPKGQITNIGAVGTMFNSLQEGNITWYSGVTDDALAVQSCRQLGNNLVEAIKKLRRS